MATRAIGDVKITRIVELSLVWETGGKRAMVEEAHPEALLTID